MARKTEVAAHWSHRRARRSGCANGSRKFEPIQDRDPRRWAVNAILKSVSRSFYLTIRLLPRALRAPVSLAYLLARATDTIADTAEIPATVRLTTLLEFARIISGEVDFETVADSLSSNRLRTGQTRHQRSPNYPAPSWAQAMDFTPWIAIQKLFQVAKRRLTLLFEKFSIQPSAFSISPKLPWDEDLVKETFIFRMMRGQDH